MDIFKFLTKKTDDIILLDNGIMSSDGRLTSEGNRLVVDLMFQGFKVEEIRSKILSEIKKRSK
jgi:hypothetical protein